MDRQIELGTPGLAGLCGFHRVGIGFVERVLLYNAPLILRYNKNAWNLLASIYLQTRSQFPKRLRRKDSGKRSPGQSVGLGLISL